MKYKQGYFFIALGIYYIGQSVNCVKSIKMFDITRPFGILVNQEDYQYTKYLNVFDIILINNLAHPLYADVKTN